MRMTLALALVVVALAGCTTTKVTSTGDMFKLSSRNVVYLDLTRPIGIDNEPEHSAYESFPAAAQ